MRQNNPSSPRWRKKRSRQFKSNVIVVADPACWLNLREAASKSKSDKKNSGVQRSFVWWVKNMQKETSILWMKMSRTMLRPWCIVPYSSGKWAKENPLLLFGPRKPNTLQEYCARQPITITRVNWGGATKRSNFFLQRETRLCFHRKKNGKDLTTWILKKTYF